MWSRRFRRAAATAALACYVAAFAFAVRAYDERAPAEPGSVAPTAGRLTTDAEPERARTERARSFPRPVWRRSNARGTPWNGRLERGVVLPREGPHFFTWDPVRRRSPNRAWRRVGHDDLVRLLLRVAAAFRRANPDAPRIGIGDLSRPRGGDFGPRYGLPGHVSHENGLDADVYYPRVDRSERPPKRPEQTDRRLAQELVDRFVRAGAVRVFVGPRTRLRGPSGIVQVLAHHDNHLHVRIAE